MKKFLTELLEYIIVFIILASIFLLLPLMLGMFMMIIKSFI